MSSVRTRRLDKLVFSAQRQTLLAAQALDTYCNDPTTHGFHSRGIAYALSSSFPIQSMLAMPFFKWVWLFCEVVFIAVVTYFASNAMDEGLGAYSHYRVTNLETRNGSTTPLTPGIAHFGLMRERDTKSKGVSNHGDVSQCTAYEIYTHQAKMRTVGASMLIDLPQGLRERGEFGIAWYIVTAEQQGSEGEDAVRFRLEGSDDMETWVTVGGSAWEWVFAQTIFTEGYADIPTKRGEKVVLDPSLPVVHFLHFYIAPIFLYLHLGVSTQLLVIFKQDKWVKSWMVAGLWFQAIECVVMAVAFVWMEHGCTRTHCASLAYSTYAVGNGLVWVAGLVFIRYFEYLTDLYLISGAIARMLLYQLLLVMLFGNSFYHSYVHSSGSVVGLLTCVGVIGVFLAIFLRRVYVVRMACLSVKVGKAKYERVWQRLCAARAPEIESLGRTVAAVKQQCLLIESEARQFNRAKGGPPLPVLPAGGGGAPGEDQDASFVDRGRSEVSSDSSSTGLSFSRLESVSTGDTVEETLPRRASPPKGSRMGFSRVRSEASEEESIPRPRRGSMRRGSPKLSSKVFRKVFPIEGEAATDQPVRRGMGPAFNSSLRTLHAMGKVAPEEGQPGEISPIPLTLSLRRRSESSSQLRKPLDAQQPSAWRPLESLSPPRRPLETLPRTRSLNPKPRLRSPSPTGRRFSISPARKRLDSNSFTEDEQAPTSRRRSESSSPVRRRPSSAKRLRAIVLPPQLSEVWSLADAPVPHGCPNSGTKTTYAYLGMNLLQKAKLMDVLVSSPDGGTGAPVHSLDQLHSQALMVYDLFFGVVLSHAQRFNGKFKLRQGGGAAEPQFDMWQGGVSDDFAEKFDLGGIKSVKSCVIKLNARYKRDVSRLLDVVRETVYFDSISDMQACLAALSRDPELEIVDVQSTMCDVGREKGAAYESQLFSGLRFVKVNVKLTANQQAQNLCVDNHVCELLLMLTDIARIQRPEDLRAYWEWRQLRVGLEAWCAIKRAVSFCFAGRARRTPLPKPALVHPEQDGAHGPAPLPLPAILRSGSTSTGSDFGEVSRRSDCEGDVGESASRQGSMPDMRGMRTVDPSLVYNGSGERVFQGGQTSWGVKIDGRMEEHLEGLCRMAGLGLSDCLDRKWQLVVSQGSDNAYKSSSHSSLFFATHAVTACMSRCRTQAFVFLVSVVLLSVSACSAAMFSFNTGKYAFGPYKHFRLETMLTRNGSVGREITSPGISTFGIIGSSRCTSAGSTIPMGARREDHSHHFVPAAEDSDIVEPSFTVSVGTSAIVSYAKGRGMAGWYFDTPGSMGVGGDGMDGMDQSADASMGHDHEADPSMGQGMDFATVLDQHPAYFNVWATNEDFDISEPSCALGRETGEWWEGGDESRWCGATWKRVGAPLWRYRGGLYLSYNRNETRYWDFVQLPIELSTSEEGSREVFVLPPAYGESLWTHVFAPFFQGSCFLLACIVARLGDRFKLLPPSNLVLAAGSLLAAFFNFIGVFYAASSGLAHLAVEQALKGGSTMILFATFYWQGPRFVYGLWAYSVADAVTWGIMCYWLFHDAFARLAIASLLTLCHALPISLLRIYHLRHSKLLLRGDQVQYDALWESLCRSEDGLACIQHLRKVVEMIGLDKDNYCRQLNRQRADRLSAPLKEQYISMAHTQPIHHIFWDIRHWCMPNRPDKESGVSSFNQLFTASSVANLLLCDLVQSWAHRCEGMFMVEDGEDGSSDARFMKWVDILRHRPEYIPRVRRCTMKRHSRAMEKLLRSYGNNPSHLLDVARGCIVFESLAQLTNCLGVMITDSNVRVERIKNRLDIEYDSDESAGYRDVCINLRVINKTAQALGAELHVCEVQLLTLEFAKLKTADGHKRYVQSRNDRGT